MSKKLLNPVLEKEIVKAPPPKKIIKLVVPGSQSLVVPTRYRLKNVKFKKLSNQG
jgi:hypothetical protein